MAESEKRKFGGSSRWAIIDNKYTEDFEWPEDAEGVLRNLGWYERELKKKNGKN